MSRNIDERVVEMRFDNKNFETNVQTSLNTIEKLKSSLNMNSASKGLDNVNTAASKINMSGLGTAVETVKAKFSSLEVMAITALANITNSVINTGKQMVRSLTIEPIKQGYDEYELKMGSIQTIMMSTGATLKEVNNYLDELNTYADKTIYSFSDMTSNIGKFTNAGVSLDRAVAAIQGVSNVAAVSGANANEASRAMYNFAQALSAGYVKLIDWKSIEYANMATVEFKNQLMESAVACGTLEKTADGMYKVISTDASGKKMKTAIDATHNFNESLSYQWMTTDALVMTLGNYADETTEIGKKAFSAAQDIKTFSQLMDTLKESAGSGWAMTWQILFGDFEEAKKLWRSINDVVGGIIQKMSDSRNAVLTAWKLLGGRNALIESGKNLFNGIKSVITPIIDAFREMFLASKATGKWLSNITKSFRDFTKNLKMSETASANLKSTFKGLFAIIDIFRQVLLAVFTAIKPLFGVVDDLGGGILGITGSIGDAIVSFDEFIKTSGVFQKIGTGIAKVIQTIINAIIKLKDKIKEKLETVNFELLHNLLERIRARLEQVKNIAGSMCTGVGDAVKSLGDALEKSKIKQFLSDVWSKIKKFGAGAIDIIGKIGKAISDKLGDVQFSAIIDLLNGVSFSAIAIAINKFVKSFGNATNEIENITKTFKNVLNSITDCFKEMQEQVKVKTVREIAIAIAILAGSIIALSFVDSDKLATALWGMAALFGELMTSFAIFDKISGDISKGTLKSISTLIGISVAVAILAGALTKISSINPSELTTALFAVASLTAMMLISAKVMTSDTETIIKGATQMIVFAGAIKILASACKDLSTLKWDELAVGLVGVAALLAEVSIFMRTAKFNSMSFETAIGMVVISGAIKILASACKDFGTMQWGAICDGLIAIGVLLTEIGIFIRGMGNADRVISTGVALVIIGGAIKILASAVGDFGNMEWNKIQRGLIGLAGALASVTISMHFMPNNLLSIGAGLVMVSGALLIIAKAMNTMGGSTWDDVGRELAALGGAIVILAVGLNAMKSSVTGSVALLTAAAALLLMAPALAILGSMSWKSVIVGLVSIAGAFTILGVAGLLLSEISPIILMLGASIALIGAAALGAGAGFALAAAGLTGMAAGLTAIAAIGTAGAAAIVACITTIAKGIASLIPTIALAFGEAVITYATTIAKGIASLIPTILPAFKEVITDFCGLIIDCSEPVGKAIKKVILTASDVLVNSAPSIINAVGETIKSVIVKLVDILVECAPAMAEGFLKVITSIYKALNEYMPTIIESAYQYIITLLDGLGEKLPGIVQAAVDLMMIFFSSVSDALKNVDTDILKQGVIGTGLLSIIITALAAVSTLIPAAMIGVIGMGMVITELALVLSAIGSLAQIPGFTLLVSDGSNILENIGIAIGKFIGGFVGNTINGVSTQLPKIASDLSNFMTNIQPFLDGISSINSAMINGIKSLTEVILLLTAANVLDGISSFLTGGRSFSRFAKELKPFGEAMTEFSKEVEGINSDTISSAAIAGKALTELAATVPKTGGLISWFTGNNNMGAFGVQLSLFGRAMKDYAKSVIDLDTNVIQNSITAGRALVELATTIPKAGGIFSWFTGNNSMGAFGVQLATFGRAMKDYAKSVTDLDTNVIQNSITAGKALVELSGIIPKTGGLISWLTGNNSISFGINLVSFGEALAKYYNRISNVNATQLGGVVREFKNLVDLANGANKVNTKGITDFANNLGKIGKTGVTEFVNAFNNAGSKVSKAITSMLSSLSSTVNSNKSSVTNAFKSIVDDIIKLFNGKNSTFKTAGQSMINNVISGINAKQQSVKSTAQSCINSCVTAIRNKYNDFYNAGKYLVTGFANGITAYTWYAEARAKTMANAAASAARVALGIHSPSKVGYSIGEYFGMGFVNSLNDYADQTYKAGTTIAASARDGLHDAVSHIADFIDSGIDSQPVIRPLLDLSQVQQGTNALSAMMSRNQAVAVSAGFKSTSGIISLNGINQNDSNIGAVVTAIGSLQKDVESLGSLISKMQVSLDGDAVVGHLIEKIDTKLGQISIHKGRGN